MCTKVMKALKILLFGQSGQLGFELARALLPLGTVIMPGRRQADFEDLAGLEAVVMAHRPDVIVNAAAYTAVDRAEQEQEKAMRINKEAPALLARLSKSLDALLVHYSTDFVFDGMAQHPYQEGDGFHPLNVYGMSKLAGEEAIKQENPRHFIFRTSWVYAPQGRNFAHTMITLLRQGKTKLSVVCDQIGAPTCADFLADATAQVLAQTRITQDSSRHGLYHLAARGAVSRCDFVRALFEALTARGVVLPPYSLEPVLTQDYPTPAQRPLNSRLDVAKFEQCFALTVPDWTRGLARFADFYAKYWHVFCA